jgi:pimeloyl-ACP methyl ester carboxylesterase
MRGDLLDVAGGRLWVEETGSGDPVVLLHAGVANADMWDGVWPALAAGRHVIRYDHRGFGRSDDPKGPWSAHADLLGLLDALGIESADLIGCSWGGMVALDAALAAPDRVGRLVLVASGPSGRERSPEAVAAWEAVDATVEAGDVATANELELRMWVDGPQRRPDEVDASVRARVEVWNSELLARQGDLREPEDLDPPAIGRLGEVESPALIITPELDQPFVLEGCRLLADEIPEAREARVTGAAHMVAMEKPDEVARLILEFLD